ncbi:metal-dependent hydrolase [Halobellus ruber]|uniref:Hydrolase n=1 Tax=Halobellus ruber TaxID=2761102 RepID=A0A7J9SJC3_9EURY|nr:metal-dependent hydrolase [Halobellus ruber]MBB6647025.1 hydrolase [Halobellus ruber]
MFVGHEFLAFALAGWGALQVGCSDRTALHAGVVAAVAALLPDLDVVYAVGTYAVAVAGGAPLGWDAFWGVANATHRVVTHTLPTGGVATLWLAAAVAVGRRRSPGADRGRSGSTAAVTLAGAAAAGAALLLAGFRAAVSPSAAVVAAGFLACVAAAGWVLAARVGLSTMGVTAAAGVGFLSHPFGDVFLAAPPPLFSPFEPVVWAGRVSLAADPTLDLLGVLAVELLAVWLGVAAFTRVAGDRMGHIDRLRDAFDRRAAAGLAYAPAAVVLPRPTIVDAHVLGATVVPLAAVVGVWAGYASFRRDGGATAGRVGAAVAGFLAGLAALTLAGVAYTVAYVVAI